MKAKAQDAPSKKFTRKDKRGEESFMLSPSVLRRPSGRHQ